jgi:hypothetical protein
MPEVDAHSTIVNVFGRIRRTANAARCSPSHHPPAPITQVPITARDLAGYETERGVDFDRIRISNKVVKDPGNNTQETKDDFQTQATASTSKSASAKSNSGVVSPNGKSERTKEAIARGGSKSPGGSSSSDESKDMARSWELVNSLPATEDRTLGNEPKSVEVKSIDDEADWPSSAATISLASNSPTKGQQDKDRSKAAA